MFAKSKSITMQLLLLSFIYLFSICDNSGALSTHYVLHCAFLWSSQKRNRPQSPLLLLVMIILGYKVFWVVFSSMYAVIFNTYSRVLNTSSTNWRLLSPEFYLDLFHRFFWWKGCKRIEMLKLRNYFIQWTTRSSGH